MARENLTPIIAAELWDRLAAQDRTAWQEFLRLLLPVAMHALSDGTARHDLTRLHGGDGVGTGAALVSAWSSFQRHFLEGDFGEARDPETLAAHFIRLTYNRWQRAERRQRRLDAAVDQGTLRDGDGQWTARDFVAEDPPPDERVGRADFHAYLLRRIDEVLEEFSEQQQRIIRLWMSEVLEGEQPRQAVIAQKLGIHQSTVSRCLEKLNARVRELLEDGEEA